jgi:hypothetical protein
MMDKFKQFLTDALGNDYYDDFSERGLSVFKKFYDDANKTDNDKVLLPRKLTAENGAKKLLVGEFFENRAFECPECSDDVDCVSCDLCDGSGQIYDHIMISWTTIKAIYDKIVEHYGN